jgi:hypothetical protein
VCATLVSISLNYLMARLELSGIILIYVRTSSYLRPASNLGLAMQLCDGLRGPLIIYDAKDPHKVLGISLSPIT